jgi:DNA helicase-2/ATP-dependent DNA helicase PcrA
VDDLGPRDEPGEVDLLAERVDVRQSARRNTFTGKTYNSLDNISQFFSDRGMPFKPGQPAGPQRPDLEDAAGSRRGMPAGCPPDL